MSAVMNEKRTAVYHVVREDEQFNKSALNLLEMVRMAQCQYPNTLRALFVDIDGHEDPNRPGFYDPEMERLILWVRDQLVAYVTDVYIAGIKITDRPGQNNIVPRYLDGIRTDGKH